jgi:FAD/FMN-containing dehydrogenase
VTGGLVSSTGVAGFTLGGGIGWLMRRHGLACDNLVGADVVTADGRYLRASADENPDLFWGLRGGGGNFGVVTSLEFQLHRVGPTILAGPIFYPGEQAAEVLRRFRDYASTLPDEMATLASLASAPPLPVLPVEVHGKPIVIIVGVYAGSPDDGMDLAAPLRTLGTPIADLLGPMPYATIQSLLDPLWTAGARNFFKSGYLADIPDEAVETLTRFQLTAPSQSNEIHLERFGGAVARVADDATAFGSRSAPWVVNVVARWIDASSDDAEITWARDLYAALEPFLASGTYLNFLSAGDDRVREAYGPEKYERLARLKEIWDPTNLFRLNQNIQPARRVDV